MTSQDLTDQQWALLEPLIPPSPPGRGRPAIDQRAVLDGILWKLRNNAPWYDLPSCYPSHQTCYRRYRQWERSGLFKEILGCLYKDLHQRGGLDLHRSLQNGDFNFVRQGRAWSFEIAPHIDGTWQFYTAMIFISLGIHYMQAHSSQPARPEFLFYKSPETQDPP
jgi:transposase